MLGTAVAVDFQLTVLGSGSSGNCSLVSHGDTHILIDAGFSGKEIMARMVASGIEPEQLTAVLVTHEHSDHIKSAHTISRKFKIPILSTEGTYLSAFRDRNFYEWVQVFPGRSFAVGEMVIHPISLPHDAADPIGFRIECGERILGHLTDFGYVSGLVRESLKGCDLLLVEANHDLRMLREGPYPWLLKQRIASRLGHLSNDSLLELLPDILSEKTQHLILAHMSETNNNPKLLTLQVRQTLNRIGLTRIPFTIAAQHQPMTSMRI
ncbi:MAG: MBL fold metallo-hydrolase [Acidobacteria bacterium]|nr:MBL fold metallo-hydrolase [Acidobacteriota bacterium]